SRSTVGTMTELNDHLKLLFARAGKLFCKGCGREVRRDTPHSIFEAISHAVDAGLQSGASGDNRLLVTFPVEGPQNFGVAEVEQLLSAQGYTRIHARHKQALEVLQDRVRTSVVAAEKSRIIEGLEAALRVGKGRVNVYLTGPDDKALETWRYSADL